LHQNNTDKIQAGDRPVPVPQGFNTSGSVLSHPQHWETIFKGSGHTATELLGLHAGYNSIRIYRDWHFGHESKMRLPQAADLRSDGLEEDFSNLNLYLNNLRIRYRDAYQAIVNGLKDVYEGVSDFDISIQGGTTQLFIMENGGRFSIPATRLSDGTLRYLCLLAILHNPMPPSLICIEEPELGLHPDLHHKIADLLKAASERTQLIVTTHSDVLVDAMTPTPEAVIVCEKNNGETTLRRLDAENLGVWLEKYSLGQLWTSGDIGGNRW
jgi:predicted ATPase